MYDMEKLKKIRKEYKYTIYDMAVKISAIFNMKPDQIFYTKHC